MTALVDNDEKNDVECLQTRKLPRLRTKRCIIEQIGSSFNEKRASGKLREAG
jgi:hypothetical protein